ncbi:MAG TPA: DUF3224 domain-containing protein [Anaerolineae bacterium]|nr:DUF3224 domain-containing protein [Anaerolineae bacterium]
MSRHATGTFEVKTWDEKSYSEIDGGPKLTRASVTKSLHGDVEGEGTLEYLMIYHADGSAGVVGLERVVGRVGDRSGSFVLQHSGTDDGNAAKITWFVVPGSGTGNLRGLRGEGGFVATRSQPQVSFTLDYDFE